MSPTISVIVTTYNRKDALELVLDSLLCQTVLPDEIIVADDGSTGDTRILIESFIKNSKILIVHCWQEDNGFRLAEIRNKAIKDAVGEYIIQIDGDIICAPNFIKDHMTYCEEGFFICGRRFLLNREDTEKTLISGKLSVSKSSFEINKFYVQHRIPVLMQLFNSPLNRFINKGVLGCNMAYWKEDVLRINGYNADIKGWGKEDDELIIRMQNLGIKKKTLKFAAQGFHLYHPEESKGSFNKNAIYLEKAITQKITRIRNGIVKE